MVERNEAGGQITKPHLCRMDVEEAASLVESVQSDAEKPFGSLTLVRAVTRPVARPA